LAEAKVTRILKNNQNDTVTCD